jgi:hypothetical protein
VNWDKEQWVWSKTYGFKNATGTRQQCAIAPLLLTPALETPAIAVRSQQYNFKTL